MSTNGVDASIDNPPSWPRPRTPLHPHRLAKLANALGISAPIPLSLSTGDPTPSSHHPLSNTSSEPRLSPTPSVRSANTHSRSKFLLHVIPPSHIPHDSDSLELTPPPSTASGYHTCFKRGTLVPLFPTLQGQLYAIAKEYALPSTTGMILYLVSSAPNPSPDTDWAVPDGPGPRLSDDIWKHLWTRVTNFEIESYSRATTPNTAGLAFSFGDEFLPSGTLRPLISPGRVTPQSFTYPLTPTGSSASSNAFTHSAPSEISQSEINSPDTSSLAPDSRAATLDLPGLTSPSVIPILAKVEFDIDKRKASWYDPWIRSRRLNHQKRDQLTRIRTRSESGTSPSAEDDDGGGEAEILKAAPLPLRLVDRQAIPRFLLSADVEQEGTQETEYTRLSESPLGHEDVEPDETNSPVASDRDSLADVIGANRDTLTDRETNLNVVQLALDGQPLSEEAEVEDELENGIDEEQIQVLQDSHERPKLSLDTSPSPDSTARSSLTIAVTETVSTFRKAAPPPLTLMPNTFNAITSGEPSPFLSSGSTGLAYLGDGLSPLSEDDLNSEEMHRDSTDTKEKSESPTEDERIGSLFANLDLALDLEDTGEFDEDDPNDRRRSQYVFKAQLDEIEKALVRLSPRGLQHETKSQESSTKSLPPRSSSIGGLSSASALTVGASKRSPREQSTNDLSEKPSPVWPAVPYSSLSQELDEVEKPLGLDDFPPPPKLALNGVSNDIPISPYSKALSGMQHFESDESKARRGEIDGHESTYPETVPHSLRKPVSSNTPVIPLSPDPFGRFPSVSYPPPSSEDSGSSERLLPQARIKYSTFGIPPERHSSLFSPIGDGTDASPTDPVSAPPSSRFSLDSTDEGKNNRTGATLNPVKSIKSLWRKNRKSSVSSGSGSAPPSWTGSGRTSPQSLFPIPNLPGPSQRSPTAISRGASRESVTSLVPPADRYPPKVQPHDTPLSSKSLPPRPVRQGSSISSMVFDQESPYPVIVQQQSQRLSSSRPRASPQSTDSLSPTSLTNRSSVRQSGTPTEPDATNAMSPTERERTGAPKSILKPWRSENSAGPPLPEQFASRTRRSRGGSEAHASKFAGIGANRVSASIDPTRTPQTSPPRRPNRGTLRTIPSQDIEAFKIMDATPLPGSGQSA